ncbi:predicted protein [Nematostella vectensis]|uniref:TRAF-type domain-containing protein n=1 Tax=Nematostella vectensis TaxID=45351 RepID=A7T5J1_NEMVE|nr:predicted protein [Nematostella vectensis]|eukprot:XP_001620870.1 hypothetical protein NEMVEDRAFT_v1g222626 [Nematostella vectensis]
MTYVDVMFNVVGCSYVASGAPRFRTDIDAVDVFLDKAAERTILSFLVKCPCKGCKWEAELRDLEVSMKGCGKLRERGEVLGVSIKAYGKARERGEVLRAHARNCDYKLVTCSNPMCSAQLPRMDVDEHLLVECDWRLIVCEYCGDESPYCLQKSEITSFGDSLIVALYFGGPRHGTKNGPIAP